MRHPNNVIEHEGWVVVRNESVLLDIEQQPMQRMNPVRYRYYNTYHEHRHERNTGFVNLNPVRVLLSHTAHRVSRLACECGETVPDTILGSLALIAWSDDNAIIR
jgi:hypothetical protein